VDGARLAALLRHDCELVVRDSTASTNDEVLSCAQAEGYRATRPLVVVSAQQSAGRGRLGRTWVSPSGGVYLSVLLDRRYQDVLSGVARDAPGEGGGARAGGARRGGARADGAAEGARDGVALASLSPLMVLAAHDALQCFTRDTLHIKWPNDLISQRGKLAGILVELKQHTFRSLDQALIVGIGVNVNRPTHGAHAHAAYLDDAGTGRLALEEVAAALIDEVLAHYERWCAVAGSFEPFAARYGAHMAFVGQQVCVRNAMGEVMAHGTMQGVDGAGRLLVEDGQVTHAVTVGEVTLRS
jgi:BirA family biotin operon repressor/biotin-[acetyl-CoA-carboxylase] ligase